MHKMFKVILDNFYQSVLILPEGGEDGPTFVNLTFKKAFGSAIEKCRQVSVFYENSDHDQN